MKRFYFILMLMLCMTALSWGQTVEQPVVPEQQDTVQQDTVPKLSKFQQLKQNITQRINDKLNEPYDTTRDKRYWWRAMKHGKINFKDSTMGYPKFVMFCYNTYMWGDRAFNSYDSAYVKPTGKNWKLFLKSNNWFDSYIGTPFKDMKVIMNSNLVSNIGVTLSFMAVSSHSWWQSVKQGRLLLHLRSVYRRCLLLGEPERYQCHLCRQEHRQRASQNQAVGSQPQSDGTHCLLFLQQPAICTGCSLLLLKVSKA